MTQFQDQIRQGNAYFELQARWNGGGMAGLPLATSPQDVQVVGVPHTQTVHYQVGLASTALASGIVYNTATAVASTLTATGVLVSAGVATLDVPRCIRITSTTNTSTTTFTIVGTDGYGQTLVWSGVGPTGNTAGNIGSYVDSLSAFKTVTSASAGAGTSTAGVLIGTSNTFGLPYVLTNAGCGLGVSINGAPILGALATLAPTFTAAYTPTGTPTATTADVRGTVAVATAVLPNDSRYFTISYIAPPVNTSIITDDKVRSYGAMPYAG